MCSHATRVLISSILSFARYIIPLSSAAAMHVSYSLPVVSLFLMFISVVIGQSTHAFCNRIFHSIVVANDRVYVDGGELRTVCVSIVV